MNDKNGISSELAKRGKKRSILFISLALQYYYLSLVDLKRLASQPLFILKSLRARFCIALDNFGSWLASILPFWLSNLPSLSN